MKLVERGQWDERRLGELLLDLSVQDLEFSLELTGFDMPEIDLQIAGLSAADDPGPDPAEDPVSSGPAVSSAGDMWRLGRHRLLCGDARSSEDYARLMQGEQASLVFSDPPYNVKIAGNVSGLGAVKHGEFAMASGEMSETEFVTFLEEVMSLMAEHSVDGSLHYLCMDWRHIHEMASAGRAAYAELLNLCVWSKTNAGMGSFYRSQHELVFVFKKGRAGHRNNVQLGRFGRNRTNVWSYLGANAFGRAGEEGNLLALHPTVKPVALVADAMLDASARGDIVLDPMGAGSTLIAAEKVGRIARGLEIDPLYVDTVIRRWQRWTGDQAVLEGSGRTFDEIEARQLEVAQ